jgi:polar amino acid transport system substrate-binding protein
MNDHIAKPINVRDMFVTMAKWITPSSAPLTGAETDAPARRSNDDAEASAALGEIPGIDIAAGLARAQGNETLYRRLLMRFRESQRDFVNDFREAQRDPHPDAATRCAHTLKGTAGTIGADAVQQAAAALEIACQERLGDQALEACLDGVAAALGPVLEGLAAVGEPAAWAQGSPQGPSSIPAGLLESLLPRLRTALENYDSDAQSIFEEFKVATVPAVPASDLRKLEQQIGDYDFDAALEQLARLEAEWTAQA